MVGHCRFSRAKLKALSLIALADRTALVTIRYFIFQRFARLLRSSQPKKKLTTAIVAWLSGSFLLGTEVSYRKQATGAMIHSRPMRITRTWLLVSLCGALVSAPKTAWSHEDAPAVRIRRIILHSRHLGAH